MMTAKTLEQEAREAAEEFAGWDDWTPGAPNGKPEEEEDAFYEGYLAAATARDKEIEELCAKMDTMGTAPNDKGKVAKRIVFEEITPAEANARYRASMKAAEGVTG